MSDSNKGNAEEVVGAALAAVLSLVIGLGGLLVDKEVISPEELASIVREMIAAVPPGAQQEMMQRILRSALSVIAQDSEACH